MRDSFDLPAEYQILPETINFNIPSFQAYYKTGGKALSLSKIDCSQWYNQFIDRIVVACGRQYLPVCRMSDGEFKFILGGQMPSKRLPLGKRIKRIFLEIKDQLSIQIKGFQATTAPLVSSGKYTKREWFKERERYAQMIREIGRKGILALHLSYGKIPFQEHFFPALGRWLKENRIILTDKNYFPFYFVYAALTGPRRKELFSKRRLLLIHSADFAKRKNIENSLKHNGAAEIYWCKISRERSLFDQIDISKFIGKVDIVFIGAGVGKPNIVTQLEPLQVPCVDAGYVFEIWADPEKKYQRSFCVSDEKG